MLTALRSASRNAPGAGGGEGWSGAGSNCRPHAFQERQAVFAGIHFRTYLQVRAMIASEVIRPDPQKFVQLAASLAARLTVRPAASSGLYVRCSSSRAMRRAMLSTSASVSCSRGARTACRSSRRTSAEVGTCASAAWRRN